VHNQRLFSNFDTLKDYCDYSLHIHESKWLLPQQKRGHNDLC